MAKQTREERLRRRLAKAQLKLGQAQEKRTAAQAKGETEIQRARMKAEQRLLKATTRVERWATAVSTLEQKLADHERSRSTPRIAIAQPNQLTGESLESMGSHLGSAVVIDERHAGDGMAEQPAADSSAAGQDEPANHEPEA